MTLDSPWSPSGEGGVTTIAIQAKGDKSPRQIEVNSTKPLYAIEADHVAECVARGLKESPLMGWDDTLGNAATQDAWRSEIGLTYEQEKPAGVGAVTLAGERLKKRDEAAMQYGAIEGVGLPLSRLILGVDNQKTMPHLAVMCDDFFERGGNFFDTAHIYGSGLHETLFGHWVQGRGVRKQIAVMVKGGHTPWCEPAHIDRQFAESLERQRTDYADLYLLHRDNPAVPVGELMDCLDRHVKAGRAHAIGVSNWTLARVKAANDYAAQHGLPPLRAVSNQFSLAEMVEPVWAGCEHSPGAAWRSYLAETGTALLAWSSQSRGFFLEGRADPTRRDDAVLVRCWYSAQNFARLARARELAIEISDLTGREVKAIHVALAYVLHQPFRTFALVGPRTIGETRSCIAGLGVALSEGEVGWLEGGE